MKELENKRILLIALTEYSKGIINQLQNMGATVDYMCDKPNNGVVCKTLGRLKFKSYVRVIEKYYQNKTHEFSGNTYDYILAIRGEYTPAASVQALKKTFPTAELILYMWDSIRNNKGIENKWKFYDKVYSFDRIDYLAHKDEIDFLPLFYYNFYVPKPVKDYKYDIAFIGTGHEDRVKIIKGIKKQCDMYGLKMYEYVFLPHKLIYVRNKLLNRNYKYVSTRDIHFKMMPTKDAYQVYSEAKCVIDIESPTQCGLTMRTIEMIGLRKKMITTNKDIVNYDFFNPNNIMVVDRNDFRINPEFMNRPYEELSSDMYEKYSLHGWILQVLGIEKGGDK